MRNRFPVLLSTMLALLAFCTVGSAGTIYRCTGDHGEVAYSQLACDSPSQSRIEPVQSTTGSGLREGEKALLRQYRESTPARQADRRTARPRNRHRQAYSCRQKQRSLDAVKSTLRRGYKPAQGEKLRRRRRAYEDYLATFCS